MAKKKPGPIPKASLKNYETLILATSNGDVALVSAIRKGDQKRVTLLCAIQSNSDDTFTPVPFAEMIEGDPYKLYEDPTV